MKILITLVSEQTTPNILFIRACGRVDKHIFVTTEFSEKNNKSSHIIVGAGVDKNMVEKISVIEDSIVDIHYNLDKVFTKLKIKHTDQQIIVNLTGGTKMMALAVYDYFRSSTQDIFYIPIGKNEYKRLANGTAADLEKFTIDYRLSIDEYFLAYGVELQSKNEPCKSKEATQRIFNSFIKNELNKDIIEALRENWRSKVDKKKKIADMENHTPSKEGEKSRRVPGLRQFLLDIEFPLETPDYLTKNEIGYLTGDWFEAYVYYTLKEHLHLPDEHIAMGAQIKNQKNSNELDVVFTFNNKIFICECKTSLMLKIDDKPEAFSDKIFKETVYKASALRKHFGLVVQSYLLMLDDVPNILKGSDKNSPQEMADVFGIRLIDKPYFIDNQQKLLNDFISKIK